MQWMRLARGMRSMYLLYGELHWISAEIARSPQSDDAPVLWKWRVDRETGVERLPEKNIAQGYSFALGGAKEIAITVVRTYLEDDQMFYWRFSEILSES
jgi:hypothetical protein